MKSLETLLKYFPTGTTEGERHILRKAFVQLDEYADIISPPPFSPRVLIGKKGSGKSAIIDFSMAIFKLTGVPAVQLKPLDLELGAIPETASVGEVTRIAFHELSRQLPEHSARRFPVWCRRKIRFSTKKLFLLVFVIVIR